MLKNLKGSRTLILLVVANLPQVWDAAANLLAGTGHENLAVSGAKVIAGLLSVLTVLARLIPSEDSPAKISDVKAIVAGDK